MGVTISDGAPTPRLMLNEDMAEPESNPIAGGFATTYTTRCPGKETVNEDCAAVLPLGEQGGVLVVADGVGGLPAGNQASAMAVRVLCDVILDRHGNTSIDATESSHRPDLRGVILEGFDRANRAVLAMGSGAATTLAVVELFDGKARAYHAGDSEILIVGQRGKIKHQTVPHSPVGYAVEAGLLNEREAMLHEERHFISNMVGSPSMHVSVGSPITMKPRDTLLLASDGLSDNIAPTELINTIRVGPAQDVMASLIATAQQRMVAMNPPSDVPSKPDDLTMIVYRNSSR